MYSLRVVATIAQTTPHKRSVAEPDIGFSVDPQQQFAIAVISGHA
jgi:hypothetical protein